MAANISLPIVEGQPSTMRTRSRQRRQRLLILTLIALVLLAFYSFRQVTSYTSSLIILKDASEVPLSSESKPTPLDSDELELELDGTTTTRTLVPLEAHIMSKCPDARDCLKEMILPAMMRVYEKVNFTLSYIGTPTKNDGVDCKHGPTECLGNVIELCAQNLYPDPKIWLGFTMCLTRDYKQIPQRELIEDCALEHAIDFDELNECTTKDDGAFGMGMLRDSVQRTADAGVKKSCTVRLNEEIYCVRDGGKWTDCPSGSGVNDLVIAVEKLYRSLRSSS